MYGECIIYSGVDCVETRLESGVYCVETTLESGVDCVETRLDQGWAIPNQNFTKFSVLLCFVRVWFFFAHFFARFCLKMTFFYRFCPVCLLLPKFTEFVCICLSLMFRPSLDSVVDCVEPKLEWSLLCED